MACPLLLGLGMKLLKPSNKVLIIGAAGKQAQEYAQYVRSLCPDAYLFGVDPALEPSNQNELLAVYNELSTKMPEGLKSFDFAILAIPHYLHFDITKRLVESGVGVIKEKPFALTKKEARELKKSSDLHNAPIVTTVQRNWMKGFELVRNLKSKLGRIYSVDYVWNLKIPSMSSGWRSDYEKARGGVLLDMGYHAIDLIQLLFGSVETAFSSLTYAYQQTEEQGLDDSCYVSGRFNSQAHFSLRLNRHHTQKVERLEILGEHGLIVWENYQLSLYDRKGEILFEQSLKTDKSQCIETMLTEAIDICRKHKVSATRMDRHLKTVDIIEGLSTKFAYQRKEKPTIKFRLENYPHEQYSLRNCI